LLAIGVKIIGIFHLWAHYIPQRTAEYNSQTRFSVNLFCGVTGDKLLEPYVFPRRLADELHAEFLQNEVPVLLQNLLLLTRLQMQYQHDEASPACQ
jgi:hypothetical protein